MKKKLTLIAAIAAVCVTLAGCNGNTSTPASGVTSTGSVSESDAPSGNAADSADGQSSADGEQTSGLAGKTAKIMDEIELPKGMKEMSSETLKMYGIEETDVTDYAGYFCASGATPDEFGIFETADANAADRVKTALEGRISSQRKTYIDSGYTPDEEYKLDDSFVEVNGNTVTYAITADNSRAKEIFGE